MQRALNWLVIDFDLLGGKLQNWMLLVGAVLTIFVILAIWDDHRRLRRIHDRSREAAAPHSKSPTSHIHK